MKIIDTVRDWGKAAVNNPQVVWAWNNLDKLVGKNGAKQTAITGAVLGGLLAVFQNKETGGVIFGGIKGAIKWGLIAFLAARGAEFIKSHPPPPQPPPQPQPSGGGSI